MSLEPKKPRLSGAQRRKIEKQKYIAANPPVVLDLVSERPVVENRLMTVMDWRREISKVYREMRSGKIRPEDGTRFVYVSEIGARLAKMQEELESIEALRRQLDQLQAQPLAALTSTQLEDPSFNSGDS